MRRSQTPRGKPKPANRAGGTSTVQTKGAPAGSVKSGGGDHSTQGDDRRCGVEQLVERQKGEGGLP
jgi:hypothetical protein